MKNRCLHLEASSFCLYRRCVQTNSANVAVTSAMDAVVISFLVRDASISRLRWILGILLHIFSNKIGQAKQTATVQALHLYGMAWVGLSVGMTSLSFSRTDWQRAIRAEYVFQQKKTQKCCLLERLVCRIGVDQLDCALYCSSQARSHSLQQ